MTWDDTDPIAYDSTKAEKISTRDVLQKCENRRTEISATIRDTNTAIIDAACELGDKENRRNCSRIDPRFQIDDYELDVCVQGPKIIAKNVANCILNIMNRQSGITDGELVDPFEPGKAEPSTLEKAEKCAGNLRAEKDLAWKMGVLRDALAAALERRKRSVAGEGEWNF